MNHHPTHLLTMFCDSLMIPACIVMFHVPTRTIQLHSDIISHLIGLDLRSQGPKWLTDIITNDFLHNHKVFEWMKHAGGRHLASMLFTGIIGVELAYKCELNWLTLDRFLSWPVLERVETKQCTKQNQTTMLQQMTTLPPEMLPLQREMLAQRPRSLQRQNPRRKNPHQRANLVKIPANLFNLEQIMIMGLLRLLFVLMVWSQLIYSHQYWY